MSQKPAAFTSFSLPDLPTNWNQVDLESMTLPPSYARLFYPVQAGFTTRGMAKRGVLSLAHTYGLHVKVKEDKGLLTSLYRFVFVGEETRIRAFHTDLQSWARGVGAEIESPDLIEL